MTSTQDQAGLADRGSVVRLVFGHMAAQVPATTARLGPADLIGEGERSAAELATETGLACSR